MNLEDKFNRIVIKEYRKWVHSDRDYSFAKGLAKQVEANGIAVIETGFVIPSNMNYDHTREIWHWHEYLGNRATDYWYGKWRPRNSRNKAINPWLELGHAMLKELRKKGWDIKER